MAQLEVWRGSPPDEGRYETYDVPFEAGQSILDGLRWIRAHCDAALALRFSCINANACKECMVMVDGKTVYACTTRLEPRILRIEPLRNKQWVKDVVSEVAPPEERLSGS